jgi:ADP-heptose:LPS heptosyltransferase
MPNSYIDYINSFTLNKISGARYIAVFNGCLKKKSKRKIIPPETLQYIVDQIFRKGHTPVVLGAAPDNKFFRGVSLDNCVNYIGALNLRKSVSVLWQCDFFISNDTGLYHAAGAMQKRGIVLWKRTNFAKNIAPFAGISHIRSKPGDATVYNTAVDRFLYENNI